MKNQKILTIHFFLFLTLLGAGVSSAFVPFDGIREIISVSIQPASVPETQDVTNVYYVSTEGSNSNPGTIDQPWRTLAYASGKLQAGDTLMIRGGTYQEVTNWQADGGPDAPITIQNFPGERVIIDGYDQIPANSGGKWMFTVWGDWNHVIGLEVTRSFGEGAIGVKGEHVTIEGSFVHHNWGAGITMMGDYGLAENNRVWYNGLENEFLSRSRGGWPAALTCARYPSNCTLRGNISWENWGEGISTFESYYTTIEDNISFNNQQNLYVSDTKYSLIQGNFVYCTDGNLIDPFVTQNGILVGDEKENPPSSDNLIINNIVYGCDRNLAIETNVSTNNLVANNTFVNADGEANVLMYVGQCENCQFLNNLIVQDDRLAIAVNSGVGWSFSSNLWSKTPPSTVMGINDQVGSPGLAMIGNPYSVNWYQLASNSLAIDKGLPLEAILQDYAGAVRMGGHDIGAHQFSHSTLLAEGTSGDSPSVSLIPLPFYEEDEMAVVDMQRLNTYWLKTGPPGWIPEDFNNDGQIDVMDIVLIGFRWLSYW